MNNTHIDIWIYKKIEYMNNTHIDIWIYKNLYNFFPHWQMTPQLGEDITLKDKFCVELLIG
jgi:hypothetical protein